MKKLWKQWLRKLAKKFGLYGTLDSERALREKNHEIVCLKQEVAYLKNHPTYQIVPLIQSPYYEPPPPVTDPYHEIHARLQERAALARHQVDVTQRMIQSQESPTRHEMPSAPPAPKRFATQRLVPPMSTPAERWQDKFLLDTDGPPTERREAYRQLPQ